MSKQWERLHRMLNKRAKALENTDTANRIYALEKELEALKDSQQNQLEEEQYNECFRLMARLRRSDMRKKWVEDRELVNESMAIINSPMPKVMSEREYLDQHYALWQELRENEKHFFASTCDVEREALKAIHNRINDQLDDLEDQFRQSRGK